MESRKSAFDAPQRLLFAPPTAAMAGKAPSFQGMKPPPGYVAGLGRGATGFTTRSDIGPGAPAPPMGAQATLGDAASGSRAAMARGFGRGRGAPGASAPPVDDEPDQQPAQFDAFQGGDAGIFAARKGEYDDDDREADEIWASVDDHMDSRRRDQREARLKAELEKYRKENPKITEQFADAKRKLQEVSYEEWDAIPDIGDYSIKKKKGGREFAPAPDTLLQKAMAERETSAYDDGANGSMSDATAGNSSSGGVRNDLTAVGEGRSSVLGLKLDAMGDSVAGQTVVDPKGYLTSLSSVKVSSTSEISDVKKARLLLKSVISTNPKHAPGWIAAARLEELAGKISAARSFAQRGCDACPTSADAWLENARLNPPDVARAVLARAVVALPDDVELWIHAAQLEDDDVRKRRVLRKALERCPNSVRLWKAVVDLSEEDDAKILLARAVECCPQHVDLWLALARLETRENARVVLNKARETLPAEPQIWIAAAELEEAHLDPPPHLSSATEGTDLAGADILASFSERSNIVHKIIERAIKSLRNKGVSVDREYWLREAETAEKAGSPLTCRAIVFATAGAGVDELDRKRTWKADAAEALARGSVETARSIYEVAVETFPGKKSLWVLYAKLEGDSGNDLKMDAVLKRAVKRCPRAVVLWLMAAKELWRRGDVSGARAVLEESFAANPESEDIWLAAFKLEFESRQIDRARALLLKAREKGAESSTPSSGSLKSAGERVFLKSAVVEREAGDVSAERALITEGLERHGNVSWKLWLMLGQLERRVGAFDAARDAYAKGTRRVPECAFLWIELAALETSLGFHHKARAVLEQARLRQSAFGNTESGTETHGTGVSAVRNGGNTNGISHKERLWLASIRRERGDAFCFSAPFFCDELFRLKALFENGNAGGVSVPVSSTKAPSFGRFGDTTVPSQGDTIDATQKEKEKTKFDRDACLSASDALAALAIRECPFSGALWADRVLSASRPQRKSRSVDALKRCGDDAHVVAAVARLFWLDRKLDKARSWFHRATTLDSSDGDLWGWFYAFEKRHGDDTKRKDVKMKCVAAAPRRGDFWCAARKDPKRWHDPIESVLERVAELVPGGEDR